MTTTVSLESRATSLLTECDSAYMFVQSAIYQDKDPDDISVALDMLESEGVEVACEEFDIELVDLDDRLELEPTEYWDGEGHHYGGAFSSSKTWNYTIPVYQVEHCTGSDYGGLVTRSNYLVVEEMVENNPVLADYVVTAHGGYGTYALYFRLDLGPLPQELAEVITALADYPLLDDNHHSEMQVEAESEAWVSWGEQEFRNELEKIYPEARINALSATEISAIFWDALEDANQYTEHNGEGVWFGDMGKIALEATLPSVGYTPCPGCGIDEIDFETCADCLDSE